MLAKIYVEALLAGEARADRIWRPWDAAMISDELAPLSWLIVAHGGPAAGI